MSPRVRVTEEQLLQALRDLGATSSDTSVTTRKVALHLGEPTSYIRDKLEQTQWQPWTATTWGRRRDDSPVGTRSNGGPNYWWAIEDAS